MTRKKSPRLQKDLIRTTASYPPIFRGLLIALTGAVIANLLHTPLPWLMGPLFATAATRVAGVDTRCPPALNKFGRWVIGLSLGVYFTPEVVDNLAGHWALILFGMFYAQILAVAGWWIYRRYGGVDSSTAWFASAVGTASEIVNMAQRAGARADHVATAHSMRVLIVVVIVPFGVQWLWGGDAEAARAAAAASRVVHWPTLLLLMAGSLLSVQVFRRVRLPNVWMLGAFLFVAGCNLVVAHFSLPDVLSHTDLPSWLVRAGQFGVGWSFGDKYRPDFLRSAPRLLAAVALSTVCFIALSVAIGSGLAHASGEPAPALILGFMPGGIAEMTLLARSLELGVAMVTALQISRMIAVLFTTPLVHRRWIGGGR